MTSEASDSPWPAPTPTGPQAGSSERLDCLDALRGFALLGILVVNIGAMSSAYYGSGLVDPQFQRGQDAFVRAGVAWLFETKFYLLFSFLFGYSFTLQMDSAARAGVPLGPRIARRQLGLLVIGLAHALLLFHGDILSTYAVLGGVLYLLRARAAEQLTRWALRLLLGTALLWATLGGLLMFVDVPLDAAAIHAQAARAQAAYLDSAASAMAQRWRELPSTWALIGLAQAPNALAMFFLGRVAGGQRWFEGQGWQTGLARWAPWGRPGLALLLGLLGSAGAALSVGLSSSAGQGEASAVLAFALELGTAPLLTLSFVWVLMQLFQRGSGAFWVSLLAPAGRMALSNYVMQSLLCALVFTSYGLGWMGRLSPAQCLGLALAMYGTQLLLSRLWLQRFNYGPLEWGLRALTLARWPRWRKPGVA